MARPTVEVFVAALRLGLTSFGGPAAHLGYFRTEYVERRRWLTDAAYAELVALAQFLPGPMSSQVGMAVGYTRAGVRGAVSAWFGFTLPSAVLMAIAGAFVVNGTIGGDEVWVTALKLVAAAVVLDAVIGMASRLASTARTVVIAAATTAALLLLPTSGLAQVGTLAVAALVGLVLFRNAPTAEPGVLPLAIGRKAGVAALVVFAVLLVALPLLSGLGVLPELAAAMYTAGSFVFGGGNVVLPLLEAETVPALVTESEFLAGYGLAQAMPGPLFTFGTFLGQVSAGVPGAVVATIAIFLPSLLILLGVLPFWQGVRTDRRVQAALVAVNAAVVGLLTAALIDPITTSSIDSVRDGAFAVVLFVLLRFAHWPPWAVVLLAVLASPLLGR